MSAAEVGRVKEEEFSELKHFDDADGSGESGKHDEEIEEEDEEYDEDKDEYQADEEDETEDDEDRGEESDDEDEDSDAADGGNGPSHGTASGDDAEDCDDQGSASSNDSSSEDEERSAGRPSYCHPYRHVYSAENRACNAQQTWAARAFTFVPPPLPVAPIPTAPAAAPPAAPIPALAAATTPNAPGMYMQVFQLPPLVAVPPLPAVRTVLDAAHGGGQPATRGLHVSTTLPPLRAISGEYLNLGAAPAHATPEIAPEVPPVPPNTPQPVTIS